MKLSSGLLLAAQVLAVLALPAPSKAGEGAASASSTTTAAAAATTSVTTTAAAATTTGATTTTAAAATTSAAAGGGEAEKNEIEQKGQFGQVIALGGGNIKTDTQFPPGTNGIFEVEFQNQQGRQLRVTENRNPAAAPQGFTALEPVSYIVELGGGAAAAQGLTLSKIDYIRNANSTLDISTGQVARFCPDAQAFVFGEGELEFEADENELTLSVTNMVGEWAVFVPQAAAAAGGGGGAAAGGEGAGTGAGGAAAVCGPGTMCRALLDALLALSGGAAAAPAAAAR